MKNTQPVNIDGITQLIDRATELLSAFDDMDDMPEELAVALANAYATLAHVMLAREQLAALRHLANRVGPHDEDR